MGKTFTAAINDRDTAQKFATLAVMGEPIEESAPPASRPAKKAKKATPKQTDKPETDTAMQTVTVDQAAQLAGVHKRTIMRYISGGKLKAIKSFNRLRIDAADLDRLIHGR